VLQPAFQSARQHGYLTGDDSELYLTEVGQREIDKLVGATHRWLAEELTDWGAGDDELLTRALDNMANQFIDEDPELLPAREVPVAIGGRRELMNREKERIGIVVRPASPRSHAKIRELRTCSAPAWRSGNRSRTGALAAVTAMQRHIRQTR
jgi:hypothetical protein